VDLPTEVVTRAALEAEQRLKDGESQLAVHPQCGTNLMVPAMIAASSAWLTWQINRLKKKPGMMRMLISALVAVPAFFLARPLGPLAQKKLMTSPDLENTSIREVVSTRFGNTYLHRVSTRS